MRVNTEVIGATDSNVVVLETTQYWKGVILYTYSGATTLEKSEVQSLVQRLTEALEKL